jgi:Xaa-Pro aminopeptidase
MTLERVNRLRQLMAEQSLEAIIIGSEHNRRYISGFTGSSGIVVVTQQEQFLFTDFRYMTQAPQQAASFQVIEHGPRAIVNIRELLASKGIQTAAFEQDQVVFSEYMAWSEALGNIKLTPVSGLVEKLRMFKDAAELQIMQEAADLADKTFQHILNHIKPGVKESDIALEM